MGNAKLIGGGRVKVYHSGYAHHYIVDFYRVEGHTQSTLGSILVRLKDLKCEGLFYDYTADKRSVHRVTMLSDTPEEAVNKMVSCMAPMLDVETWPLPQRSIPLPLTGAQP